MHAPWNMSQHTTRSFASSLLSILAPSGDESAVHTTNSGYYYYTSDLPRAVTTAHLVDPDVPWQLDERLRELAKGVREGVPKTWTEEQARLERRRLQQQQSTLLHDNGSTTATTTPVVQSFQDDITEPKLETSEQGWHRMKDWCNHVLFQICQTHTIHTESDTQLTRNVIVVAMVHSGILRLFLTQLLGKETLHHHPLAQFETSIGGKQHLLLPNTSVTTIEMILDVSHWSGKGSLDMDDTQSTLPDLLLLADIQLLQLADTSHYQHMKVNKENNL
jgi:broad specificity phosphatase PhoE